MIESRTVELPSGEMILQEVSGFDNGWGIVASRLVGLQNNREPQSRDDWAWNITLVRFTGAQLDAGIPDPSLFYRDGAPSYAVCGEYESSPILGGAEQRQGLSDARKQDACDKVANLAPASTPMKTIKRMRENLSPDDYNYGDADDYVRPDYAERRRASARDVLKRKDVEAARVEKEKPKLKRQPAAAPPPDPTEVEVYFMSAAADFFSAAAAAVTPKTDDDAGTRRRKFDRDEESFDEPVGKRRKVRVVY